MNKRSIIIYWLLILVPALVMSFLGFKLLSHEQERLNTLALAAVHDRARAIAENLQVTVEAVEEELTAALTGIPEAELEATLPQWERTNPLIRNVFIWTEQAGLVLPLGGAASTGEERGFISRFEGLFSGRVPWPTGREPDRAEAPAEEGGSVAHEKRAGGEERQSLVEEVRQLRAGREALVGIAQAPAVGAADSPPEGKNRRQKAGGWIPWFAENRLYILGWVRNYSEGPVYGVELELVTLLSRVVTDFPVSSSEGLAYALIDDAGQLLHQTGRAPIETEGMAEIALSLAPHLPHWELAVYAVDKRLLTESGRGFLILAGLLLAIFVAAMVLGGSLLTWQAHRNLADAREKTSFVSNVSHELKTPLTSIRMYAELLAEDRVKDARKKRDYLQVIVSESQRLTRLVNNVLDFSRLEQGRKKYHLQDIDLAEFLREFLESHKLRIQEAGLELKTDFPEKGITLLTDRDALEQVLLNLIDNAIKYGDSGEELTVSLASKNPLCEVRVQDRGPGVPETHRERIFEKFHRVDDSLTTKRQGAGLGLSISLRILRGLGGDLLYHAREGGGSCFVVQLPLNPPGRTTQGRGEGGR